jgi:hypothetical protein
MITPFRVCTLAALILFVLLGIFHREPPAPDPAAALVARLRAEGHTISKPRTPLWVTPGFAFSVADCPAPVDVALFDFDEILSPGMLEAVSAIKRGTTRVSYNGMSFDNVDRAQLYRLRLSNGVSQLLHGKLADPPVILLFWPASCTPTDVF